MEFPERLFDGAIAVIRPIGVHYEGQVFGVIRNDVMRTQMNLGHGPALCTIRAQSGKFANGSDTRRRVRHDTTESQRLFVALAVVRFGRSSESVHHFLAHVRRANEGLAYIGGDFAGQRVFSANFGLTRRAASSLGPFDGLPLAHRIRRALATYGITKFLAGAGDIDRTLARDAAPTLLLGTLAGLLAPTLLRSQGRGRTCSTEFGRSLWS